MAMLQIVIQIVKTENTVSLRSLALNGMFNILVCVDGTHPQPNISTKMRLSNIQYTGMSIGIIIKGTTPTIFFFTYYHLILKE